MNCTKYDDYELGRIGAAEMKRHLETCAECRRQAALDERLTLETASLREPVEDAGLWGRIEAGLAAEAGGVRKEAADKKAAVREGETTPGLAHGGPEIPDQRSGARADRKGHPYFLFLNKFIPGPANPAFARTAGVAALALVSVGLAAWLLFLRPSSGSASGLMADAALARVETEEREYAAAIAELEAKAGPKLAEMDFSLMALYRDRLETIDSQIERCREAIDRNPWNAHIRGYMLAALQDKKETLREILSQ
jgi:hypothetical protein